MTLSPNANLSVIKAWLDKNMLEEKCIKACCQEVSKIPQTKGIYFWFMKKSSYKEISNIMTIKPNEAALSRSINGSKYDLVYVGTAGARNNSNGQNTGNLQERLKWHLCNNKNISSLCNGTMSTFRRTLGALLASDLIENDLQKNLDKILCKNFYIYYIEYPGSFGDVKNGIAQHEEILINTLRPIFNLSKNPNTANSKHTTHLIQERRRLIEAISKEKHCLPMKANVNQKSLSTTKAKPIQTKEDKFCIEFKIKKTENISEVASKIKNLPDGPCSIELYSENKKDVRTYVNSRLRLIRTSNRTVSQYFNAPDTKNGNVAKWHIVQNEMNDKKKPIEVITVRVCKILNSTTTKTSPAKSKISNLIDNEVYKAINPKKLRVVMMCSSRKNNSFFTEFPNVTFANKPQLPNEKFPDGLMSKSRITWREYLETRQDDKTLLKAYELYTRIEYSRLYNNFQNNLFILSAGWGLVHSEFKLPKYDITFSQPNPDRVRRNQNTSIAPIYIDFKQIGNSKTDIVFVGTPDYIPLFISLTQHLKCRKIIYWKKANTPERFALPNDSFEYRYYNSDNPRGWFYELAQDLCNNILP